MCTREVSPAHRSWDRSADVILPAQSGGEVNIMKKVFACSVLFLLFGPLSVSRGQSQQEIAKKFAGMWRLASNPQRLADGTTREAANSVAYAFFDADASHMCFVSMNPSRPEWKSETAPTPEEALSAMKGFGAYCGTVEIHAKEGFILRRYEINQNPNAVGRTTKRWYTFQGTNRMSLRVDTSELTSPVVDNTLIWERVAK